LLQEKLQNLVSIIGVIVFDLDAAGGGGCRYLMGAPRRVKRAGDAGSARVILGWACAC
jgi:hypothetical protein